MKSTFKHLSFYSPPLYILLILVLLIVLPGIACSLPRGADQASVEKTVNARLTQAAQSSGADNTQNNTPIPPTSDSDADDEDASPKTATATATITLTPTLENPMIHATTDTNCREGPGVVYDIVGYLLVGKEVPVLGRLKGGGWWYIQHPTQSNERCWVWSSSTEVEGDTSDLPYIDPPPTPTPSPTNTSTPFAAFSASFSNVHNCGGAGMQITYQVGNTGNMAFESARIDFTDVSQGTSSWSQFNTLTFFPTAASCPGSAVESMGPGSTYFIMHGPATLTPLPGDTMQATLKLCTENNLGGTCVNRTLNYIFPAP